MPKKGKTKLFVGILSVVVALLLGALIYRHMEYVKLQNDIHFANDLGWTFERDREIACKGDLTNAADVLWKLHFPGMNWTGAPQPFHGAVEQLVERQRKAAERDIIAYIRMKTGENLGDDPEPWIAKFGNESVRDQLAEMKKIRIPQAVGGR